VPPSPMTFRLGANPERVQDSLARRKAEIARQRADYNAALAQQKDEEFDEENDQEFDFV
jgi:hypothetical protein